MSPFCALVEGFIQRVLLVCYAIAFLITDRLIT